MCGCVASEGGCAGRSAVPGGGQVCGGVWVGGGWGVVWGSKVGGEGKLSSPQVVWWVWETQ